MQQVQNVIQKIGGPIYNTLCKEFKSYNIIEVLPVENISQIDFKAPSFYSKDVREIAHLLQMLIYL